MIKFAQKYEWLTATLLLWSIMFAVPSFRYRLKVMAEDSLWIKFTIFPNNYWDTRFHIDEPELLIKVQQLQSGGTIFGDSSKIHRLKSTFTFPTFPSTNPPSFQ